VYHAPFDVVLTDLNVFQPDILFVADKHAAILTTQGAEGAPDLVVEILSPRTAEQDVGPKRAIYARTGVEELWIIDPANRRVQVYRLQENADAPAATYGDQGTIETPLLPDLEVHTADVFRQ
jgi:Uma2 family endonuclease